MQCWANWIARERPNSICSRSSRSACFHGSVMRSLLISVPSIRTPYGFSASAHCYPRHRMSMLRTLSDHSTTLNRRRAAMDHDQLLQSRRLYIAFEYVGRNNCTRQTIATYGNRRFGLRHCPLEERINVGIRIATNEDSSKQYYTSRLGIRYEFKTLFHTTIRHSNKFRLKMLHCFVDSGINDTHLYCSADSIPMD
ncbi:hypothetical protein BDU57DRAFT_142460 [Ampelomyces quisqualis]|uniref:Uncharacterized protein n=1 Tax=Ampelomyces quisqualis TaxID=50730 RepID=A0A6A5QX93_AMPQU|nr:hypothetical protein BDU57DRAFT_142460 [Ampelomyces quisqualis]